MVRVSVRRLSMLAVGLAAAFCACAGGPPAPKLPGGPDYCFAGANYTFAVVANDPSSDSAAVLIDWGDSTKVDTSGWFRSGDTVGLSHAWAKIGTYEVRAWVRDHKRTSKASDPLDVQVVLHQPPGTPSEPVGPSAGVQDSSSTFTSEVSQLGGLPLAIRFEIGRASCRERV